MSEEPIRDAINIDGSLTGSAVGQGAKVEAENIAGRDVNKLEQHLHLHLSSPSDLSKLYQESFPVTYEDDRTYHSLDQALRTLWQVVDPNNKRTGYAVFLQTLAALIEKSDPELASDMRQKLTDLSLDPQNRIFLEELSQVKLPQPEPSATSLLIEIEPRKIRQKGIPAEFRVSFYPWQNGVLQEKHFEEVWFTLDEIPAHVEAVLNNRYHGSIHTLELFVPIDVLVHHSQFDQSEYQDDLGNIFDVDIAPKRFGSAHEIALRSLERQRTRLRHDDNWKKKWSYLIKCPDVNVLAQSVSLLGADLEINLRNSWPLDEGKALATLKLIKHDDLENRLKKVLGLLFGAGVPVILWSRKVSAPLESSDEIELTSFWGKCQQKNYEHLWKMVHDLRRDRDAMANPEHLGNHLTLIWDTPQRMLPDKKEFGE